MKNKLLFLFLLILSLSLISAYLLNTKNSSNVESVSQKNVEGAQPLYKNIKLGDKILYLKVADSEESREQGLSGVKDFSNFDGMLFVFQSEGTEVFWMKDMLLDLDIVWIDKNKKVIGIEKNVSENTYNSANPDDSKLFSSPAPILYVLELPSGSSENLGISVGDILDF
jgi:uncharacterized membrane protein (UPF0127 family)